ncbi:MAG TPA: OpgC domain-containing protein [Victivallales bacterium]|nr:OpgC domain-containing protein [Victivallales bacterium]
MKNEKTIFKAGFETFDLVPVERDNRIDSLRGLFLVLMSTGHFGGWITEYTWQFYGYATNAEGFVFVSGFVFALVYGKYITNFKLLTKKICKRCFTVYRYHLILVIILPFIALLIPAYKAFWCNMLSYFFIHGTPLKHIISSAILLNQPTYMDILPMYAIFILFSLPLLLLMSKGYDYYALAICIGIWFIGQYFNPVAFFSNVYFPKAFPGILNIFSWQLLFYIGAFLGFRKRLGKKLNILDNKIIMIVIFAVYIITLLSRYNVVDLGININAATKRIDLAWLRLVSFLSAAFVFANLIRPIPLKYGFPWLNLLGKHSLQVFSFHILMLYFFIEPLKTGLGISSKYGDTVYVIILVLFLASLTIPALWHKTYVKIMKNIKMHFNPPIPVDDQHGDKCTVKNSWCCKS